MAWNRNALIERFPASEGWIVSFNDPRFLTLTVKCGELCQVHRNYRHLGLYQGKVAVYEGPIEFHEKIIRVENINLESLEPGLQTKLEQVNVGKTNSFKWGQTQGRGGVAPTNLFNAALENLDESKLDSFAFFLIIP